MNICVVGAGYVGLITALSFAKVENNVICIDRNIDKVNKLNRGEPTIYEEGLESLLRECLEKNNIEFSIDLERGVRSSQVIFITVGTPSLDNGDVDMSQVYNATLDICKYIDSYKVLVNKSTVPVGTQKQIKELLIDNNVSVNDFDVISNPEFLREGRALYDFFYGERIVIGYDSQKAKNIIANIYKPFNIKIIYTTPETAEVIKYASNAFLATKISFINEIANLCSKVGADVETVSYAMGLDNRISPKFLRAGIGFGGSCFPKDTKALIKIGAKYGCEFNIIRSTVEVNEKQKLLPVGILLEHFKIIKNKTVSILGITFKPKTDDTREAPALYIINELANRGVNINVYDPMYTGSKKDILSESSNVRCCDSLYDALIDSECAIICTEWDEFYTMDMKKVKESMKHAMIIDGRNILDKDIVEKNNIVYYSIGR